jgi:hypothetical protein
MNFPLAFPRLPYLKGLNKMPNSIALDAGKPKRRTSDFWKESLLNYFLSDLGMELNQTITLPRVFLRAAAH